jgi:hypothetical protein
MKRTLLFLVGCFFMMPLFCQSQMKVSLIYAGTVSSFGRNDYPNFGISLGHQHHLLSRKIFKVLMSENLEYKKAGFSYYEGGLGAGTSTSGDINFLNIKTDFRGRIGNTYFVDLGIYASYALSNSISNGEATFRQICFPTAPNQVTCTEPKSVAVVNKFGSIDYGILFGIGFNYKKIEVNLNIQVGLANVAPFYLKRESTTLQQVNLSGVFPISFEKKDKAK